MGVKKKTQKNVLEKHRVEKLYKKFDPKSKTVFSSIFLLRFGRFSVRGVQKHDQKNIGKINLTPSLFRTLTHPPTTGVTDFFAGPLQTALCPLLKTKKTNRMVGGRVWDSANGTGGAR
jgi:hypothetical protein